jgi:hypothetical protein
VKNHLDNMSVTGSDAGSVARFDFAPPTVGSAARERSFGPGTPPSDGLLMLEVLDELRQLRNEQSGILSLLQKTLEDRGSVELREKTIIEISEEFSSRPIDPSGGRDRKWLHDHLDPRSEKTNRDLLGELFKWLGIQPGAKTTVRITHVASPDPPRFQLRTSQDDGSGRETRIHSLDADSLDEDATAALRKEIQKFWPPTTPDLNPSGERGNLGGSWRSGRSNAHVKGALFRTTR